MANFVHKKIIRYKKFSVSLSLSLSLCLSLSVSLSLSLCHSLSVSLSLSLPVSVCLSVCLSLSLPVTSQFQIYTWLIYVGTLDLDKSVRGALQGIAVP